MVRRSGLMSALCLRADLGRRVHRVATVGADDDRYWDIAAVAVPR